METAARDAMEFQSRVREDPRIHKMAAEHNKKQPFKPQEHVIGMEMDSTSLLSADLKIPTGKISHQKGYIQRACRIPKSTGKQSLPLMSTIVTQIVRVSLEIDNMSKDDKSVF